MPTNHPPTILSFVEDGQIITLNQDAGITIMAEDLDGVDDIVKFMVWVDDDLVVGVFEPSQCLGSVCTTGQCPVMANWWVVPGLDIRVLAAEVSTQMTIAFYARPMDCPLAGCDVDLDVAVLIADRSHDGVYAKVGTIRVE